MENSEDLAAKFAHIKGWGIDATQDDNPNYPMKKYTGDDHKRLDYERSAQQGQKVEILMSNDRPQMTRVFGTSVPPSGLSGMIRRVAFRYSENRYAHWLPLLLADRVNMVEGMIEDVKKEIGADEMFGKLAEEWKENKQGVITKAAVGLAITGALLAFAGRSKAEKV